MVTSYNPKVVVQSPGIKIHSHNICSTQLEIAVLLRRLDDIPNSITKHAVARHLDVEDMLLAIPPAIRQDPLRPLTTSREPMHGHAVLGPYQALIIRIPMELEMFLVCKVRRYGELDAEPMRGPAGSEGVADFGGREQVFGGFFEGRAREIGRRVDGQLHPFVAGSAALVQLAVSSVSMQRLRLYYGSIRKKTFGPVLAAIGELT